MDNADGGTLLLFRLVHSMAFFRDVFLHSERPYSSLMAAYHVLLWQGGWAGHGQVQQLCGKPWILVVRTMSLSLPSVEACVSAPQPAPHEL